jgi:hypothetical protein
MRLLYLLGLLVAADCGGSQAQPGTADGAEPKGDGAGAEDLQLAPERPAPPELGDDDKKDIGGLCNMVEPDMYDAEKQALATLDDELGAGTGGDAAEQKALDAAVTAFATKAAKLGKTEAARCAAIFEKRTKRRLYDHDPTEEAARDTVDACVKRVVATFGKQTASYDMGGGTEGGGAQGPFCPDDFPVPQSLRDLPYTSKAEDWESATWKCLSFGLRAAQAFQLEYSAPAGANEFHCIARYLPRQGGAPIELRRGGKVGSDGGLVVAEKIVKTRMK